MQDDKPAAHPEELRSSVSKGAPLPQPLDYGLPHPELVEQPGMETDKLPPLWLLLAITLLALITLPFDWLYYRIFGRG